MDPRDRHPDPVDGGECAACGGSVPPERIRLLATREGMAFAELPCQRCGSVSLAIVVSGDPSPATDAGRPDRPPLTGDDVLDMHRFLAEWSGDLASLVTGVPAPDRASRPT